VQPRSVGDDKEAALFRDEPIATKFAEDFRDRLTRRGDVVGELLMCPHDLDDRPVVSLAPELSGEVEEEAGTLGVDVAENEIAEPPREGLPAAARELRELKESSRSASTMTVMGSSAMIAGVVVHALCSRGRSPERPLSPKISPVP